MMETFLYDAVDLNYPRAPSCLHGPDSIDEALLFLFRRRWIVRCAQEARSIFHRGMSLNNQHHIDFPLDYGFVCSTASFGRARVSIIVTESFNRQRILSFEGHRVRAESHSIT